MRRRVNSSYRDGRPPGNARKLTCARAAESTHGSTQLLHGTASERAHGNEQPTHDNAAESAQSSCAEPAHTGAAEPGMVTGFVAVAILAIVSISLLVVQGTHAVALAVDAQNRADLAAISAAQDYLGGKSEEESCARATANAHGFETRCIRRAENFTITLSKAGSVPWILPRIEAEATAGPVSVSLDSLVK